MSGVDVRDVPQSSGLNREQALITIQKVLAFIQRANSTVTQAGGPDSAKPAEFGLTEMRKIRPITRTLPNGQTEQSFDILEPGGLLGSEGAKDNTDFSVARLSEARQFAIDEAKRGLAELTKPKDQGGEFGLTQEELANMSFEQLLQKVPQHWITDPKRPEGEYTLQYLKNAHDYAKELAKKNDADSSADMPDNQTTAMLLDARLITPDFSRDLLAVLARGSRKIYELLNAKASEILEEQEEIVQRGGSPDPQKKAFAYDLQLAVIDDRLTTLSENLQRAIKQQDRKKYEKIQREIEELNAKREEISAKRKKIQDGGENQLDVFARAIGGETSAQSGGREPSLTVLRRAFENAIQHSHQREPLIAKIKETAKKLGWSDEDCSGLDVLSGTMKNARTCQIVEKSVEKTVQTVGLLITVFLIMMYLSNKKRPQ